MFQKLKRNRKGSLPDILFISIILLFAALVILIGFKITSEINDQVASMPIMPARATAATSSLTGDYSGVVDNTFLFFAIGMGMVVLALAALVRVHPIFIPFFFIGLVLVIFFSGILSNIYQEMAANPNLAAQATQLTFINHILEYLPFIVGVFGFLLMLVMYKLWKVDQE